MSMWEDIIKKFKSNPSIDDIDADDWVSTTKTTMDMPIVKKCEMCGQEFYPIFDSNLMMPVDKICTNCIRMTANNNLPEMLRDSKVIKKSEFIEKLTEYAAKNNKIKDGIIICSKCDRAASLYYSQNGIPMCGKCAAGDDNEDYADILLVQ